MYITCFNCKNTWDVPAGSLLGARLKLSLGAREYPFPCPNCGTKNILTDEEFRSSDHPQNVVPVTGAQSAAGDPVEIQRSRAKMPGGSAPTNPVGGEGPGTRQRQAVVRTRGVKLRIDHSIWSEVTGKLSQGGKVTIVDTWTDGESTWVQLGPERWVNLEQDDEPVIELIDD